MTYLMNNFFIPILNLCNLLIPLTTIIGVLFSLWQHHTLQKEKVAESKRLQASQVYAIETGRSKNTPNINFDIVNNSDLPIYNVFLSIVSNKTNNTLKNLHFDNQPPKYFSVLDVGRTDIALEGNGHSMGGGKDVPILFFTDSNNHGWFRDKDGKLTQIDDYVHSVLEKNGVAPPYSEN